MSKILFLDIDGVILSFNDLYNLDYVELLPRNRQLPLDKIAMLNYICKQTGCEVVVSSTWRNDSSTQQRLIDLGVPIHSDWKTCNSRGIRGDQIDLWLARHPEVTHHVILDDDRDFYSYQPLVFVCGIEGLKQNHIRLAIKILEG